jgi:tetratricopeptide (TPR) repeat protein
MADGQRAGKNSGDLENLVQALDPKLRLAARSAWEIKSRADNLDPEIVARGYLALGFPEDAIRVAQDLGKLKPRESSPLVLESQAHYSSGDFISAASAARKALALNPSDMTATAWLRMSAGRIKSTRAVAPPGAPSAPASPTPATDAPMLGAVTRGAGGAVKAVVLAHPSEIVSGPNELENIPNPVTLALELALMSVGSMLLALGLGRILEEKLPSLHGVRRQMGIAVLAGGLLTTGSGVYLLESRIAGLGVPFIIRSGWILNRSYDSRWDTAWGMLNKASRPIGQSYCLGACLPINAETAIVQRGLRVPGVTNNAQRGALYEAQDYIFAWKRRAIGGSSTEILIPYDQLRKLKMISESVSNLPKEKN